MVSRSHQATEQGSGFRTLAVVGLAVAYVAVVLVVAQLLSPELGGTDLSTMAATLVVAGLLLPIWRRLTGRVSRRRPASLREERTQMTLRGIALRLVAGLLAVAVFVLLILFLELLGPFTSESEVEVSLATLGAGAVFIFAHQRLPR